MSTLRDVIADAHEVMHRLELKRRRMQELALALDAKGDQRAGDIIAVEIAGFDRIVEILHDMMAYLESLDTER